VIITQENNIWSQVDKDHIEELREFLSYESERWVQYPYKHAVPYKRSFVGKTGFFFTGFLPLVEEQFPDAIISRKEYVYTDIKDVKQLGDKILRPYQLDLLNSSLRAMRGVLKAPTGSGKTLVEAAIIASLPKLNTLVTVHTKSLLHQIRDELSKLLKESIGKIGDGEQIVEGITVGMIQTLSKFEKSSLRKQNWELIIVEEVHHAISKSYQYVLSSIDAQYRFGFSATPKDFEDTKGEYLKVIGLLGPILHTVEYEEVKDILAIPEVRIIEYEKQHQLQISNWQSAYRYGIEGNDDRNRAIAMLIKELTGSILIMVKTIRHGNCLLSQIPHAVFVQGRDEAEVREQVKEKLKKENALVISTPVFGEGVDIPALDVLINAGAGKSKIQTIQWAGRALRRTDKKKVGVIIDFDDRGNRYLENHSLERQEIYRKLGWLK